MIQQIWFTLFCAKKVMKEKDLLITYGDIVFNDKVLQKVINSNADISVVVDKDWKV